MFPFRITSRYMVAMCKATIFFSCLAVTGEINAFVALFKRSKSRLVRLYIYALRCKCGAGCSTVQKLDRACAVDASLRNSEDTLLRAQLSVCASRRQRRWLDASACGVLQTRRLSRVQAMEPVKGLCQLQRTVFTMSVLFNECCLQ